MFIFKKKKKIVTFIFGMLNPFFVVNLFQTFVCISDSATTTTVTPTTAATTTVTASKKFSFLSINAI